MATNPGLRGARRARHALHDHLHLHLNRRINQVLAVETDANLVEVAEWHPAWRPSDQVNKWPVLMVTSHHGLIVDNLGFEDGQPVHRWDWIVRAWVWARGEGYLETADRVEAIAGCIVDELLARPGLSDPDDGMYVRPVPMSVSLSDIEQVPRMRASIAGAFVEAVVTMAETATADPPYAVGTVDEPLQIDLDVEPKDPTA